MEDSLQTAIQRIKELELTVTTLTDKLKVAESENLALLKQLVASRESSKNGKLVVKSKLSTNVESTRDVATGDKSRDNSQEQQLQSNLILAKCLVTGDERESGFVLVKRVKDEHECATSLAVQHGAVGPLRTVDSAESDACRQAQLGSHSHDTISGMPADSCSALNKDRSLQNQLTRLVALRVMYLGGSYHGFASQGISQKTVESALFAALHHTKLLIGDRAQASYSRCGRTDKGVSAIGQLIALRLRSRIKTPVQDGVLKMPFQNEDGNVEMDKQGSSKDRVTSARASRSLEQLVSSDIGDEEEINYVYVLNRVLPEDIRVLGWCPVPQDFNARFSCMYREYAYYFLKSNLDINAMKLACSKFLGDHDFRNFCKMDVNNVHNYRRIISMFEIRPVNESGAKSQVWVMCVRGTAFLWHQVRCMAAILLMVGQGLESPTIVGDLLDVGKVSRKPQYKMAPELPLALHTCGFQGLTLHCPPKAARDLRRHVDHLVEQTLLQLTLLQEVLAQLPSPDAAPSIVKNQHIPLLRRDREPSYEERVQKFIVKGT